MRTSACAQTLLHVCDYVCVQRCMHSLEALRILLPLTVDRDISAQTQTMNLKQAPMKNEALVHGVGDHTTSRERDPPVGKPTLTTEMGAGMSA